MFLFARSLYLIDSLEVARFVPPFLYVPPLSLEVWGVGGGWGVYRRRYTICIMYQYIGGTRGTLGT